MASKRSDSKNLSEASNEKPHSGAHKDMGNLEVVLLATADRIKNPTIQHYFRIGIPYVVHVAWSIEVALPKFKEAYEFVMPIVERFELFLLVPSAAGLILCFFGGEFTTLIAAVEAYRQVGYQTTLESINSLVEDWQKFTEVSKKDDDVDADNDGKKDVLQITNEQLIMRKTLLFFKAVDPNKVTTALRGIQSGLLAVIATLKLEFAKAITLGSALAEIVQVPADKFLIPLLEPVIPVEYRKWCPVVVSYTISYVSMTIAFFLQRIISAFHSAMRGGLMCSRNLLEYCSKRNIVTINHEETILDEVVGYALAACGLYCQMSWGFSVPFPLNIILFPFSFLEGTLVWLLVDTIKPVK